MITGHLNWKILLYSSFLEELLKVYQQVATIQNQKYFEYDNNEVSKKD